MLDGITREKLLTREETSEALGVKPQTLACWACTGRYGLPFVKVGRLVRYRMKDIEKFLKSRTVSGGPAVAE